MALQDTALALIEKFGENRTVVLEQPSTAPADPAKPWDVNPTDTTSNKSAPAVVVPVKRNLVNGNSVQQGDEQVLIAGLSLGTTIPSTGDRILDQGQQKNIIAIDRIRPGQTDFLWKLQVRAS